MMSEILFRGKRLDNGEWVYGYLGKHTSLDAMIIDRPYITMNDELSAFNFWIVDPSTVGQYAGLTDKNGKRIFEGDILKIASKTYIAFFERGAFYLVADTTLPIKYADRFEVIGNIYDNLELL